MIYKSYYKTSNINYYNYIIKRKLLNCYFNLNGPVQISTDANLKFYMTNVKPFPTYRTRLCSRYSEKLIFAITKFLYLEVK